MSIADTPQEWTNIMRGCFVNAPSGLSYTGIHEIIDTLAEECCKQCEEGHSARFTFKQRDGTFGSCSYWSGCMSFGCERNISLYHSLDDARASIDIECIPHA